MTVFCKKTPLLIPPPQGGRKCFGLRSLNRVSSPLEGEGQGGGYRRKIPTCHQRTQEAFEKTRRTLKSAFGSDCVVNRSTAHAFADKRRSDRTSSISFVPTPSSSSSWMGGSMRMMSHQMRAERLGSKRAATASFGSGTMKYSKISKGCLRQSHPILTNISKKDLPPSKPTPSKGVRTLKKAGLAYA